MTDQRKYPVASDVEDLDLPSQRSIRSPEPEYDSPAAWDEQEIDPEMEATSRRRPSIPEGARRPQDRQRKEDPVEEFNESQPVYDEATGVEMVTVRHDGLELLIPADPVDWPIKATMAFEEGKVISAVRALLTPAEFQKILGKNYRNKDFGKLYEKLAKAGGFDSAGN
ncbi:tail assembly chaperone [Gordonia phage Trine]|uniref:Tail assembly chaperone n=1 Tax=Gordonia phage Trine TaxID=2201431 RepID=A0A2Z4Q8V1_9CAUD|nr:tail assembly chaperone [Gordonia phage Trine]AWY06516.1 tail assembly chaperone [Gordonia phage Trine]